VATTIPAGNVSENVTPISATALAAGFVIVKVSVVVALRAIAVGLNALAIDGGATTARLADAVPPVPPSVEVTAPVVLFCVPAAVPVTFTEKVQELLVARVAPARLTVEEPASAVMAPPPQAPVNALGEDTTKPAGRLSVNATPVNATVFATGLLIVKLNEVEPFNGMLAAPKALMITGGAATVMLAFEVLPLPPSVEVI
jgi:hypothetical protein